jgi:hypothetical protein
MYKVYWTDAFGTVFGHEIPDMTVALKTTQALRNEGHRFVSMVSENPDSVGRAGVDSVENGMLPNGDGYSWKKRRI